MRAGEGSSAAQDKNSIGGILIGCAYPNRIFFCRHTEYTRYMPDDFPYYSKNERALLRGIASFSKKDQRRIQAAIRIAKQYHAGQVRDEADTENAGYIIHCVRVARWLAEHTARNPDAVIAGLLHDSLEDTRLTATDIKKIFGPKVLSLVRAVTRPRPFRETEVEKIFNKPKQLKAILRANRTVRMIKTADTLDNMRSWPFIPRNHPVQYKFPRWFNEAKKFYIPIALTVDKQAAGEMEGILNRSMIPRQDEHTRY